MTMPLKPFGRTGSKRIGRNSLRDLLGSTPSIMSGRVTTEPGATKSWDYDSETGELTVSVLLDEHETPLWCLWGPGILGPNFGLIAFPPDGAEVEVGFPSDDFEGQPVILAAASTGGGVPDGDLASGRILIVAPAEVWIYNGSGTPEPLVTKSEFDAHLHPTAMGNSGIPTNAPITGTQDLKSK